MRLFTTLLTSLVTLSPCMALESFIDPTVYTNQFGSYYVPKHQGHRPAVKRLMHGKVHELDTLIHIQEIYQEGTSIIHAGTYFGDMLPFFSKLVGTNTVWAFEPVKQNYICACETVKLNDLKNIRLFNLGLSNENKTLWMQVRTRQGYCGGASKIVSNKQNNRQGLVTVQASTIDHMLKDNHEKIGIIHLDIEFHEKIALMGAKNTIATHKPVIILEVHHNTHLMDKYMKTMGYKNIKRVDRNCVYIPID